MIGETAPSFAPLWWLLGRTTRNRWQRRARRARQPRYAIAVLAGLAYFWLVLYRPGRQVSLGAAPRDGTLHLAYALGFALLVASWWLFGSDQAALNFSQAEVELLFPAPVTRRQLVALKLLQAQLVVVFSVCIWVLLLWRMPGSSVLRAVSLWMVFSILLLHRVGASLVRESAAEHGAAGARRHAGAFVVLAIAAAVIEWGIVGQIGALRAGLAAGDPLAAGAAVLHSPTTMAVLYPFRLVLAPLFTVTAGEWAWAAWPPLLILIAHYVWVLRTDAAFEEAAAENAARRARMLVARRGRSRVVVARSAGRLRLPLAAGGRPEVAFIWKNTLALGRTISVRTLIAIAIVLVAALAFTRAVMPEQQSLGGIVGRVALGLSGMLVLAGPLWVRNDLRLDMMQLELLRSYPVRGATLVRAEIGASLGMLGGLQMALVLVAFVALPAGDALLRGVDATSFASRTALLVVLAIVLPVASALGLAVQNAGALLFPAWMRLGLSRPGGIEAVGQSILTMFGSVVMVTLLLLGPGIFGGVLAALAVARAGLWGLVPGALLGAALVIAELWGITAWLGRVFERTESVGEAEMDGR